MPTEPTDKTPKKKKKQSRAVEGGSQHSRNGRHQLKEHIKRRHRRGSICSLPTTLHGLDIPLTECREEKVEHQPTGQNVLEDDLRGTKDTTNQSGTNDERYWEKQFKELEKKHRSLKKHAHSLRCVNKKERKMSKVLEEECLKVEEDLKLLVRTQDYNKKLEQERHSLLTRLSVLQDENIRLSIELERKTLALVQLGGTGNISDVESALRQWTFHKDLPVEDEESTKKGTSDPDPLLSCPQTPLAKKKSVKSIPSSESLGTDPSWESFDNGFLAESKLEKNDLHSQDEKDNATARATDSSTEEDFRLILHDRECQEGERASATQQSLHDSGISAITWESRVLPPSGDELSLASKSTCSKEWLTHMQRRKALLTAARKKMSHRNKSLAARKA